MDGKAQIIRHPMVDTLTHGGWKKMGVPDSSENGLSFSLADVAFLANSENRVAVLDRLREGSHSRHVLAEQVGVSRVTLGRILDDLEARHWISQHGQLAEITLLGAWVVEEFGCLCTMMHAERKLRNVAKWFPDDGYGFHIRRLADADITLVTPADASAPIDQLVRQLTDADRVRAFSFAITGQFLDALWRHVVERERTYEWVFTSDVLAVLKTNAEMASRSRDMLESGRAKFHHYEGPIPHVTIITGGTVNIRLADREGAPSALLQSTDEEVRTWAATTFEDYRSQAHPLDPETFTR